MLTCLPYAPTKQLFPPSETEDFKNILLKKKQQESKATG